MGPQKPTQLNDSVYEFYVPDHGKFNMEVVAFHGLRFSDYRDACESTWSVQDEGTTRCWLREFIPTEFPSARILSVSYDSCAKVSDETGRMSFSNIGQILVQDIIHLAKVGQRGCPVVLIGYCLGGLVIKQLCTEAEKQYDQAPDGSSKGRLDQFLTNVRVIVTLDTPHAGSSLGKYLSDNHSCNGPVLEYLNKSSPALGKLNTEFDSLVFEREWQRRFWWCSWNTLVWDSLNLPSSEFQVVEEASAKRGEGISIPADHSGRALSTRTQLDYTWIDLQPLIEDIMEETNTDNTDIPDQPRSELNRKPTFVAKDDRNERKINDWLYEMYRPEGEGNVKLEVIFFPGSLREDSYKSTWMTEDNQHCWLRTWLPNAFPDARILAVSYNAVEDENVDLFRICETLIQNIKPHGRGTSWRPLILVGHCFGGLVIKELCDQVENAGFDARDSQEFLKNVRGVAYYGTSHLGYSSDDKRQKIIFGGSKVLGGSELSERAVGRPSTSYTHFIKSFGWKEIALGETRPTQQGLHKMIIVDEFSASHGVQRNSFFPVAANHYSICKPKSPSSNSFQYLVHFIDSTLKEAQYKNMNIRRKKRRGVAIIISMENDRIGSEADRIRLQTMAEYLQLSWFKFVNENPEDLPSKIERILKEEVTKEDECILCCVAAHGAVQDGKQLIFGSEDEFKFESESEDEAEINTGNGSIELLNILKPIANCVLFEGKPKVFLVNCCRVVTDQTNATTGKKTEQNDLHGYEDCLLMYSTQLGKEAWRRENGYLTGTLFVTEVENHINLLYQTTDVEDILKKAEKRVSEVAKQLAKEEQFQEVEQFPVLYTSLRKRLSWRPR